MIGNSEESTAALIVNGVDGTIDTRNRGRVAHDHAEHFATDHLLTGLKGRTVSSGLVTGLAQICQFVLTLGSTLILARLLSPRDFGLVAMVTTIMSFLRIFNEAGLSTATVQREGITHTQVSNLFWTNIVLGGSISLLLAALAPAIGWFYREPHVVGVTLMLCVTFLLSSSTVQHVALLTRQMRFRVIAAIQISATSVGVIVGVGMAWTKWGYWSLVGMQLAMPVTTCILTWFLSSWRPQLPRRDHETRSLLNFGAHLTVSTFLWSLARGSDGLLIGRSYGPASLGLYSRAAVLLIRPLEQFIPWIGAVLVPSLSRLQKQPDRYRRTALQVLEVLALISFLSTGLLLPLARPLVYVLLGPKWGEAAPIFAAFTLVALYSPLACVATWLLTSQGRGGDFLKLSVISSCVTVSAFALGLRWGPFGVAICYSISCVVILLPVLYYIAGRHGPVSTRDLWTRFFTHIPLFGIVCTVTFLTRMAVGSVTPWKEVAIAGLAGLLTGISFICVYAPARRTARAAFVVLRELRSKP